MLGLVESSLLEIDVANGYERVSEVDEMITMSRATVALVREPTRLVIAADWRNCRLFGDEVAARTMQMLTGTAGRIERSAILHGTDHATAVLQVFRLVKEAHQNHRQLFTDKSEMERWLGEVLTDPERARLHTFLASRS